MIEKDSNQEAARVVGDATHDGETLAPDIEAAWAEWIKGIQQVDERVRHLLRAAFETGAEAGSRAFAASGGRAGGKARAEKLTPERRSEIAKQAAEKRWESNESPDDS